MLKRTDYSFKLKHHAFFFHLLRTFKKKKKNNVFWVQCDSISIEKLAKTPEGTFNNEIPQRTRVTLITQRLNHNVNIGQKQTCTSNVFSSISTGDKFSVWG